MAKFIKNKDAHLKEDKGFFSQGGKTSMFGKGDSHAAEEGVSGKSSNSGGKGGKDEFAKGGNHAMFGKGHAGHKEPAISGKANQNG